MQDQKLKQKLSTDEIFILTEINWSKKVFFVF